MSPINKTGVIRKVRMFRKYDVNRIFSDCGYNGYIRCKDFNVKNIREKLNTVFINECK